MKSFRLLGLALVTVLVSACSGNSTTSSPLIACYVYGTVVAPPQMIYPASNATGIPDGNFTLKLSDAYGSSLELISPSGAIIALTQQAPTPAWTVPPLSAGTTYTINGVFASPQAGCPSQPASVGTFTTQ